MFYLPVWGHRLSFFLIAFSLLQKHTLGHSNTCKHTHILYFSHPPASGTIHLLLGILFCKIVRCFSHDSSPPVSLLGRTWCIFRIIKGGQRVGHRGLSDVICWVCSYERLSKHSSANHHSDPQAVAPFSSSALCHIWTAAHCKKQESKEHERTSKSNNHVKQNERSQPVSDDPTWS